MAMNATAVMPSSKQRFNNSAHSYFGLFIKDAVPIHDVEKNPLQPSPDDRCRSNCLLIKIISDNIFIFE